ncbi:MAG: CapA family protein [Bifidobacteriaceae bacterium]|jgi:poly-gamma-glutamate synthesis protein (capsule biosynthesis protein)|nr:CapA family protein [Bifidobacteriaceae bacterium]
MRFAPRLASLLAVALVAGAALGVEADWALGRPAPPPDAAGPPPTVTATPQPTAAKSAPPAAIEQLTVTLAFGGDLLTHQPVNRSAAAGGDYDFTPLLAGVDPWIQGADLAICQLEVPLAPPGQAPTGYPLFAAPAALARDLAEQGWDGCTTSSNHSLDQGWAGVRHTIETLTANGLGYAGTALSAADSELPQLYRLTLGAESITVAHIAFTYGTNGLPLPAGQPWCVNTPIALDRVVAQAAAARAAGADIVVAAIHAGVEYRTTPTAEQREIAQRLAASGLIDAMIGDHPHVAEPIELVPGGVDGNGMWTIYSMGNFLSNQTDAVVGPNTDTGAVVYLTAAKGPAGAAVTAMTWAGVTVDAAHGHRVQMLQDATAEGSLGQLGADAVALRYGRLRDILGAAPEQLAPPEPSGAALEVLPRG